MMALADRDFEETHQRIDAANSEGRQARRLLPAFGFLLLAGMAPQGTQLLAYEASTFAADACLAPAFDGPGCAGQMRGHPGGERPTASAALIAPEASSSLDLGEEVLLPGDEVTYWCGEPQCSPPRRVIVLTDSSA